MVAPLRSTAICDQGDSVTGGGYSTGGIAEAIVVLSRPGANEFGVGGDRWTVEGVKSGLTGGLAIVQAIAQCYDNPPLR